MAAGNGSRYGALKQFDELGPNNEFLFEFTLFDAISAGMDHVVIVTKKEHVDDLRDYLGGRLPDHVKLDVVAQELDDLPTGSNFKGDRKKPWGTAHAVWTARDVLQNRFVVTNADDFYGAESMRLAVEFMQDSEDPREFASIPYKLKDTLSPEGSVTRAICNTLGDYLSTIEEVQEILRLEDGIVDLASSTKFNGEEVTSMNFWVFGPEVFPLLEKDLREFVNSPETGDRDEIYIPKQVQQWIKNRQARVRLTGAGSDWFGVTYAKDKERAVERLKSLSNHHYPAPLWKK